MFGSSETWDCRKASSMSIDGFCVIQGTFGVIQGTFGVIQGTFGVIQGTLSVIQGEHLA